MFLPFKEKEKEAEEQEQWRKHERRSTREVCVIRFGVYDRF